MERFTMPGELADELCARLGVALPTRIDDVTPFYRAWCERIPFDSISKALARREGTLPPGGDPVAFAEQWLATGLGGTCWGHTSSMGAVLEHAGIRCRVGLDRFQVDEVVDLHAFLVVEDGDRLLALDTTHSSGDPLLIRAGERGTHPAYPIELHEDDGRLVHQYLRLHRGTREPGRYAVLSTDLDAADLRTFCEVMRAYGMRAQSLYHRRFTATEMHDASPSEDGSALVLRRVSATGQTSTPITDASEAFAAMGYGPAALDVAIRAGLVLPCDDGSARYSVRPAA
jgi:hypothetical protein